MKSAISLFSKALIAICTFISPCLAQNVSINLEPINPPIQIHASGGSFNYNVTVHNAGTSPQTFDAWIMVQLPSGSWYGPVLGPVNLTLPGGASVSRQRTQPVPESAPAGSYVYEGRVGIYPNTIWNSSSFTFAKTLEGSELWVARYNGPGNWVDEASSLTVDEVGNVYATGYSGGIGTSLDYATIKYNLAGVQLWVARYNGPGNDNDWASSIVADEAGNIYVTGTSHGSGTYSDYATIKYDSAGAQLWTARYNGTGNDYDGAYSLAVDEAGNVYVTGYSIGSGTYYDYATIKYNSLGVQQWIARYNGPESNWDLAYSLDLDVTGNVYVTGASISYSDFDYATIKYNSEGVQQWVARYNGPGNGDDEASSLAVDGAGNVYVTGYSTGSGSGYDYATIKYNSEGMQQWVARYNGPGNNVDEASSLAVDGAGNVYVTGCSAGSGTGWDFATIKYDSAGVQQWASRYNGPLENNIDIASALAVDGSGNVYVTGYSSDNATLEDYATIKYNAAGEEQWVARYNGSGNLNDHAVSLAIDDLENAYVTGFSTGTTSGTDYVTIKYSGGTIANWQPVEELVFGAQEAVTEYKLNPCYPNPFNATADVRYKMQDARQVSLRIYDSAGRLVTTLVDGWREAGTHELTFDAGDLPSGVYFCRMEAGEFHAVTKLMLVK